MDAYVYRNMNWYEYPQSGYLIALINIFHLCTKGYRQEGNGITFAE